MTAPNTSIADKPTVTAFFANQPPTHVPDRGRPDGHGPAPAHSRLHRQGVTVDVAANTLYLLGAASVMAPLAVTLAAADVVITDPNMGGTTQAREAKMQFFFSGTGDERVRIVCLRVGRNIFFLGARTASAVSGAPPGVRKMFLHEITRTGTGRASPEIVFGEATDKRSRRIFYGGVGCGCGGGGGNAVLGAGGSHGA